jgi:hypothetical protein
MGWGNCGHDKDGRPIGYLFKAKCDEPGCNEDIDRGLSFVCGGMHGGDTYGCGKYFCYTHLHFWSIKGCDEIVSLCSECLKINTEIYGECDD